MGPWRWRGLLWKGATYEDHDLHITLVSQEAFRGGPIFDGTTLHMGMAWHPEHGLLPEREVEHAANLAGDILAPGYVDLQVNGGGGVLLNDAPSVEGLTTIAAAHRSLGATTILPTLITDTNETTRAAIAATVAALQDGVPGIAGLHLEGPHLAQAKKGAHAAELMRPMTPQDLDCLCQAAEALPRLMVTLAPESATEAQVRQLTEAGVLVSLGHTNADFETCLRYARAGARVATHLFNAMSGLGARAPGLVGAVLQEGALSAGLIADGTHVHPATIDVALRAKRGPGRIFLVSDAMAVAGTGDEAFHLNGRRITRSAGRLTLEDGTLAGADLDLTRAIRVIVEEVGLPLEDALAMATSAPAAIAGLDAGHLRGPLIRIAQDLSRAEPV